MLCRCAVCVELWYLEVAHFSECDSRQHVWHLTWLVPPPKKMAAKTYVLIREDIPPCLWLCGHELLKNKTFWSWSCRHSIVPGPLENEAKCFRTLQRSKPGGSLWLIKIWHVYIYSDSDWSSGGVCGQSLPQESFFLLPFLWFLSKYVYPWFPWKFEGETLDMTPIPLPLFDISFWPETEGERKDGKLFYTSIQKDDFFHRVCVGVCDCVCRAECLCPCFLHSSPAWATSGKDQLEGLETMKN